MNGSEPTSRVAKMDGKQRLHVSSFVAIRKKVAGKAAPRKIFNSSEKCRVERCFAVTFNPNNVLGEIFVHRIEKSEKSHTYHNFRTFLNNFSVNKVNVLGRQTRVLQSFNIEVFWNPTRNFVELDEDAWLK